MWNIAKIILFGMTLLLGSMGPAWAEGAISESASVATPAKDSPPAVVPVLSTPKNRFDCTVSVWFDAGGAGPLPGVRLSRAVSPQLELMVELRTLFIVNGLLLGGKWYSSAEKNGYFVFGRIGSIEMKSIFSDSQETKFVGETGLGFEYNHDSGFSIGLELGVALLEDQYLGSVTVPIGARF